MAEESQESGKPGGSVHLQVQMSAGQMAPGAQMTAVKAGRIDNLHVHGLQVAFAGLDWLPAPPPVEGSLPPPGELPPGSRLELLRNVIFTGRDTDLQTLARQAVFPRPKAGSGGALAPLIALGAAGIGGVGKTQLAVEFCFRWGRCYYGVHWLDARQEPSLEIAACGEKMALQPWPDRLPEQAALTERLWQAEGAAGLLHLAVLDNVEDEDQLRRWLPRLRGLQVLFTSRQAEWSPDLGVVVQRLDVLPRYESKVLLFKLAPRLQAEPENEIQRLCERLGDLPLALHLAGSYLRDVPLLEVGDYVRELEGNLLAHESQASWSRYTATAHEASLAATFDMSWQRLEGQAFALERKLFLAAGWCSANTPIPPEILGLAVQHGAQAANQAAAGGFLARLFRLKAPAEASQPLTKSSLARALSRLVVLGLLEATGGGVKIHPLVAAFARALDEGSSQLKNLVAALILQCNQVTDSGLPAPFLPLRAHAESAADQAQAAHLDQAANLFTSIGFYHLDLADFSAAKSAMERAFKMDEADFGPWSEFVAGDLTALGAVLVQQSDYAAARLVYERSLAIRERLYGAKHPEVARELTNLCFVYRQLGDFPAARTACQRALAIDERAYGAAHEAVAEDLNCLGNLQQDQGDLPGARIAFERALAIDERLYGPEHPKVANDLSYLANILRSLDDLPAARAVYERALDVDVRLHGPIHPDVRRDVNELATVLRLQGDLNTARDNLERALSIDRQVYGDEHPNVGRDYSSLGSLLQEMGDLEGARQAYERALSIIERTYGENHPDFASELLSFSTFLQVRGDLEGARTAAERAVSINTRVFGPQHFTVAAGLSSLAALLQAGNDHAAAREVYERALVIFERVYGPDHPEVANTLSSLGAVLEEVHDLVEARACYERALAISQKQRGENHATVCTLLGSLGDVLAELDDLTGARAAYERALVVGERVYGPEHKEVAILANNLGSVLRQQGDLTGACEACRRAVSILERIEQPDAVSLNLVKKNFAFLEALKEKANPTGAQT